MANLALKIAELLLKADHNNLDKYQEYKREHPLTKKQPSDPMFLPQKTRAGKQIPNITNFIYTNNSNNSTLHDSKGAQEHGPQLAAKMKGYTSLDHEDASKAHANMAMKYHGDRDQLAAKGNHTPEEKAQLQNLTQKIHHHTNAASQHDAAKWYVKQRRLGNIIADRIVALFSRAV